MDIQGILLKKSEIKTFSDKFSVQEFYLDCSTFNQYTGDKYENILKFQLINKNIDKIEKAEVGQRLKIQFQPRGRFYEKEGRDKFHAMNLDAFGIEILSTLQSYTRVENNTEPQELNYNDDDLPF